MKTFNRAVVLISFSSLIASVPETELSIEQYKQVRDFVAQQNSLLKKYLSDAEQFLHIVAQDVVREVVGTDLELVRNHLNKITKTSHLNFKDLKPQEIWHLLKQVETDHDKSDESYLRNYKLHFYSVKKKSTGPKTNFLQVAIVKPIFHAPFVKKDNYYSSVELQRRAVDNLIDQKMNDLTSSSSRPRTSLSVLHTPTTSVSSLSGAGK